ncbi:MAG TPA: class I SAM-dependent methyltransferase [Acidimicrobiales bacterium]|nr:class I SAM-dependent methyltransferase [Acidimicrobiales bacterium]
MIYQHPLAYLLGLEGLALLRAWAGDHDRAFVEERLDEVRRLLAREDLSTHAGVEVARADVAAGYRDWARTYDDEPRNTLFEIDEPIVHGVLDGLRSGQALDAACGTGRFAASLVARGHQVIGVDASPEMLAVARTQIPEAEFRLGDVTALPVEDASVDLVVCGLALSHVASLPTAMTEFARVLRPGGDLVISDVHHDLVFRGSVVKAIGPAGEPGLVATHLHTPGDYLRAALDVGLDVRRCEEPRLPSTDARAGGPMQDVGIGEWADWPWSLIPIVPEATRVAWATPALVIWHFRRSR